MLMVLLVGLAAAAEVDKEVLDALENNNEVSVIVVLKDLVLDVSSARNNQDQVLGKLNIKEKEAKRIAVRATNNQLQEDYNFDLKHRYSIVNGFSGKVTKEGLQQLIDNDLVETVEYDQPLKILLDQSAVQINATATWRMRLANHNITGSGETVCVIDTGIDYTHPNLGGCTYPNFINGSCSKVIGGYDVADGDDNPIDQNGHGTHVAGIVASENDTYRGVAPDAKLIAVKIFSGGSGSTSYAYLLAGLDWCADSTNVALYNISVISMSVGCATNCTHWQTACDSDFSSISQAVNLAVAQNISVMIAAGNDGWTDGISDPACLANATPVGGVDDSDGIVYNRGNLLSLLTPGFDIISLNLGSGTRADSGTSMATPHAAGAVALLQQFNKLLHGNALTAAAVGTILNSTGKRIDDTSGSGYNFSRINIFAAIISLDDVAPQLSYAAPTPANNSASGSSVTINITVSETLPSATLQWNNINETMNGSGTNFYVTKTGLAAGNYTYLVYGTDYANNTNTTELRTVQIDADPTITINTPVNNSYQNIVFNLNIVLTDQNISSTNYNITNNSGEVVQANSTSVNLSSFTWTDLVNLSDGNYTLTVSVVDVIGNDVVTAVNFVVDRTIPALFGESRTSETVYNNDTVVFTVNATDLYLSSVLLEINDSGWRNISMNLSGGNKYITNLSGLANQLSVGYRFHALDSAGNINSTDLASFTVQNRVISFVNITSPAAGDIVELGDSIAFTSTATDPDSDTLTYTWNFGDGATVSTQNPAKAYNATGEVTVTLNVSDPYGSYLNTSLTLTVNDTRKPVITAVYDSSVHLQSEGSTTLNVTAVDPSGIFNLTTFYDNISLNLTSPTYCSSPNSTARRCAWSIAFDSAEVGSHNLTINATDNFTPQHSNVTVYTLTVTSCSDSTKNGDETGTDCGGSCSACSSNSSSSSSSSGSGSSSSSSSSGGSESASSSSSSSSSGGSLSTADAESAEEATEEAAVDSSGSGGKTTVLANEPVIVTIDNPTVTEISITAKVAKEISLEVSLVAEKPEEVPELENVYQYLKIDSDLTEEELDEVKITFKVPVSWLDEHDYSKKKVVLNHYVDESWEQLSTKLINETETELTYRAKAGSFSYFAITAKESFSFYGWITGAVSTLLPAKGSGKSTTLILLIVFVVILTMVYFFVREKDTSKPL